MSFSLKVLTVNIHKGFTFFNRRFMLPELRDAVRSVGADVVFLQEVSGIHTGHERRVANYLFSLNMGALVGGVALRFRLYSRLGLEAGTITRIISLSMLTNWAGYLLLAGVIFGFYTPALPPGWQIGSAGLQILGFVLLATALLYLLLCAVSRQRSFTIRGHELSLPSLRLALLQIAIGVSNWLLMGGTVFILLQQKIAFPTVTGVLLVAAVAGVITHVPTGLGVLEAIFVVLLSHLLPKHELLAALLAYRGIYYLAPLALAVPLYLFAESRAKKVAPARIIQH